jgi:hypothetical protein
MTKRNKQLRLAGRKGIWLERGDWTPVYAYNQQSGYMQPGQPKPSGIEYQHYMFSGDGQIVCAGVTRHEHINQAIANQIFRVWARWRSEYDARTTGDYPARHCAPVTTLVVFPVDAPNDKQQFEVRS